jgi:two-component system, OmpR family, response regulator VicR
MNILVCDDDILTLKTVEHKLKKEGYQVLTAIDGAEGSKMLKEIDNAIDFLITDQHMPYFSGIELINLVRNELKLNIPIIMLTRVSIDEIRTQAFEMGADDYITKPFSPDALTFKVKHVLMRREQL